LITAAVLYIHVSIFAEPAKTFTPFSGGAWMALELRKATGQSDGYCEVSKAFVICETRCSQSAPNF